VISDASRVKSFAGYVVRHELMANLSEGEQAGLVIAYWIVSIDV